jgi:pimeloyl-ACP methyl ester carboxylesterase
VDIQIERQEMGTWKDAPTRTVDVDGVEFAYRELGTGSDVPVVFLHHLMAVLDDWDPRIIDGIAARHRVIAFDNRDVGATGSSVPHTVEQMGADAIAFIRALGLERVDLLGFSLGGGVAQMVALQAPKLVRRMILAGTGPRGGGGIEQITKIAVIAYIKAALTFSDPRNFLFFPRTAEGKRAASECFNRLKERRHDRDKQSRCRPVSLSSKPFAALGRPNPTIYRSSPNPSSSQTATTTSWSTVTTQPTWSVGYRTPS